MAENDNGLLTRLEEMVPQLRARGRAAEKAGRIPDETIAELAGAGAFHAAVPASFGGLELDFPVIPQIFRVLGRGCVATSWTMGFLIYHNFQFAHFPEKTQREVFGGRGYTMAPGVIVPGGVARPVTGGFELSGEWRWLTGILHADWVLFSSPVIEEGGTAENIGHHGRDLRRFFVPVEECEIMNTWDVSAMSASGSHDMKLDKVFVPEHHQIKVANVANRTSPGLEINKGPLWQVPFITFASLGAVGPMIGGTEGLLEMITEILKTKVGAQTGNHQQKLMTQQVRIARLTMSLKSLIKLWEDELDFVWDKVTRGKEITLEERVEARMIVAHCAKGCDGIANELVVAAGSRSIYNDSHIQRFRREINALATHAFFDHDHLGSLYGSTLLGLDLPPQLLI